MALLFCSLLVVLPVYITLRPCIDEHDLCITCTKIQSSMYFDTTVVFRKFETKFNIANFQIQGQITRTNLIRLNPQSNLSEIL